MKKMFGVLSLIAIMTVAFTVQATEVDNFVKTELVGKFEPVTVDVAIVADSAFVGQGGEFATIDTVVGGLNNANIVTGHSNYIIIEAETFTLATQEDTGGVKDDIVSKDFANTETLNYRATSDTGEVGSND